MSLLKPTWVRWTGSYGVEMTIDLWLPSISASRVGAVDDEMEGERGRAKEGEGGQLVVPPGTWSPLTTFHPRAQTTQAYGIDVATHLRMS